MEKIYYLIFLIASVSTLNEDLMSTLNDIANELTGDNKASWDDGIRTITIFSDFDNTTDRFFFQVILPWIVDNIGNDLRINYRFRNSGRSAGPRLCGLRALRANSYTQAEFLRCEAQGNPILTCVNQAPIDRRSFNRCINRRVNDFIRTSQCNFETLISEQTPLVRMPGRRELSSANPIMLLRLICQSYGRIKPIGCLRPTALIEPRNVGDTATNIVSPNRGSTTDISPTNVVFPSSESVTVVSSNSALPSVETPYSTPAANVSPSSASTVGVPNTLSSVVSLNNESSSLMPPSSVSAPVVNPNSAFPSAISPSAAATIVSPNITSSSAVPPNGTFAGAVSTNTASPNYVSTVSTSADVLFSGGTSADIVPPSTASVGVVSSNGSFAPGMYAPDNVFPVLPDSSSTSPIPIVAYAFA